MINTDLIQKIKVTTNLLDLFTSYGHEPIKAGSGYKVLCPFHDDHEPSLSINIKDNLWQCFACGVAGDAVTLVMKLDESDFVQAITKLAKQGGYRMADLQLADTVIVSTKKMRSNEDIKHDLLLKILEYYKQTLSNDNEGIAYLKKRGISNHQLNSQYHLGYSDGTLLKLLNKNEISLLTEYGLLLENKQERFFNCVIFPLYDRDNKLVSFYGRRICEPGNHFYLPGPRQGLFNQEQLKNKKLKILIITESILDAFSFINKGIVNVLPLYGTNGFTPAHQVLIDELKPEKIVLALDGDKQGQQAAAKLSATLFFNCQTIVFTNNQDANDYFMTHDKADFERLVSPSVSTDSQKTSTDMSKYELKHARLKDGKLVVTIKAINKDKCHIDTVNLYSKRQRQTLISELTAFFVESVDVIERDVSKLVGIAEKKAQDVTAQSVSEQPEMKVLTQEEEQAALGFLKQENLLDQIIEDYESIGYTGESMNKKLAYLVMTSRKMANPLSLIVMSNSAAGKSSLQQATLEFCPDEESKHFTRLTQQSLYYLGGDNLKHKFISIEEEEGSSDASYSLKTLLSAKVLNVVSATSNPQTGQMQSSEYKTEGPVAVMVSTTNSEVEAEFASRTLIISIDESAEQTLKIHQNQRFSRTLAGRTKQQQKQIKINLHQNAQRLLDSDIVVINNYADKLTFPTNRLKHRRGNDHYLDLIDTIAFLRQKQKVIKSDSVIQKYIEVDIADIQLANDLFTSVMGWTLDELRPPVRKLLKKIITYCEENLVTEFTRRELRECFKEEAASLHRHLNNLVELEYVQLVSGANRSRHVYELLYVGSGDNAEKFVIGLKNPCKL
jgi:DNA primase